MAKPSAFNYAPDRGLEFDARFVSKTSCARATCASVRCAASVFDARLDRRDRRLASTTLRQLRGNR